MSGELTENIYKAIFEHADMGIGVVDSKGNFIAVNAKFQEMMGYDAEELYRFTFADLTHIDDRTENLLLFSEVIYEKRPFFRLEKRFIRKNGDILWVRVTASPIKSYEGSLSYSVGFIEDISDRREIEEKLRENEKKFRNLLDHAIDAIVIIQDHVFKYVNPQMTSLTGYGKDELLSASCEVVLGQGEHSVCEICRRRLAGEALPDFYESVFSHKDGRRIDVEIGACKLVFSGRPAELVFIRDITERKMLEAERLKSSMLESVGQLAGGIAHDFNNLLTVIMGNTNMVQMKYGSEDNLLHFMKNIENASLMARKLTRKLITFSTGGFPVRKKCSLSELIESIIKSEFPDAKADLKLYIPENLWLVKIDPEITGQAINNILTNSIESMPDGGTVEISCENFSLENGDEIFSLLKKRGKYVKLEIIDHGIGIALKDLNRVFDPYFSTKDRGSEKGMGLGLAIAQSVIKKNKGVINIESHPGQGTMVTIYFPATGKRIET